MNQSVAAVLARAPAGMRLETELLVGNTLGWSRSRVLAFDEHILDAAQLSILDCGIARLRQGEPLAYISGAKEFYGLSLKVTPDVLIPRPDTELLVDQVLAIARKGATVLDMGTGSGAIAIALKHNRPDLQITASEFSAPALAIAQDNAATHGCDIKFRLSNWFSKITDRFDVIVSNPPYISASDPHLPALSFEPVTALVSGEDGLDDIKTLLAAAPGALNNGGSLLLEHGYDQGDAVNNLFTAAGFKNVATHNDLAGHARLTAGEYCSGT